MLKSEYRLRSGLFTMGSSTVGATYPEQSEKSVR